MQKPLHYGQVANAVYSYVLCIETCTQCAEVSLNTAKEISQRRSGIPDEQTLLLKNCALLCKLSAMFLQMNTPNRYAICEVCAETCEALIVKYSGFPGMSECLDCCLDCAQLCRETIADNPVVEPTLN